MLPERKYPPHFPIVERHNRAEILLVTVCTAQRKKILANNEAAGQLAQAWREAADWHVGRFVIMPDHVHFFCAAQNKRPLAQWMRYWRSLVSLRWSKKSDQPIWQRNFWDRQIRSEENYGDRWEYVLQNPFRAGLIAEGEVWPWSGEIYELRW